jgi:cyclopropane fatty-acyl-phospholipid synthase-like methyltransferase
VTHWYYRHKHDVVDKLEKGCINEDIARYKTWKKYDLIISVSTLEHVGFDCGEYPNPNKIFVAIKNMKSMLKKDGLMFITIPVGYNPNIPWGDLELTFHKLKWRNGYEIAVGYYSI